MELPVVEISFLGVLRRVNMHKIAMTVSSIRTRPAMAIPTAKLRCEMQILYGSSSA